MEHFAKLLREGYLVIFNKIKKQLSQHSVGNVNQDQISSWKVNVMVKNAQIQFRVGPRATSEVRSAIRVSKAKWGSVKRIKNYLAQ